MKDQIEIWWKKNCDETERYTIDKSECLVACKRILKNVFGDDLKFDETVFDWAFHILKFDDDKKEIEKLEFASLL